MELREAMSQISQIRLQMARSTVFRGYRSLPVALSGVLAIAASIAQAIAIPDPIESLDMYLTLWVATAVVSIAAAGLEMAYRCYRTDRPLQKELSLLAVEQFLPSVVAGCMVTAVIVRSAPDQVWMLPGLWAIVYSLGIFASYRLLPLATFWVGMYFMLAGGMCLVFAQGSAALSPWTMALTFGTGQLLAASILYWNLERDHD